MISSQEIIVLDLNKLERSSRSSRKISPSFSYDYESYLSERDELIIVPLDESNSQKTDYTHETAETFFKKAKLNNGFSQTTQYKNTNLNSSQNFVTSEKQKSSEKVRLPCHMNETLSFCNNACQMRKFCSHKK